MNPLVSIIVPFYNTEIFIESNINSILNQTYKNIEVLYINDGSTDNSENIVRKYNKIILLNKAKTNAGDSRNYGLKHATGKYVFFFDSDDLVDLNCVNLCVSVYKKSNYECVLYYSNKPIFYYTSNRIANITNPAWNKCFRMDLIKKYNLYFSNTNNSNDLAFTHAYLTLCNSYITIDRHLYTKRDNPSSIMKTNYNEPNCIVDALIDLAKMLKHNDSFHQNKFLYQEYYIKQCKYMEKVLNENNIDNRNFLMYKYNKLSEIMK